MNKASLKIAVARAGRGRRVMRRLPEELGGLRFPASLEGGSKFLRFDLRKADLMLTTFAKDYITPGTTVWDIGANVGLFTFTAAGLSGFSGQVVAVEADVWLAKNLRDAIRRNPSTGAEVVVVPAAISDRFGLTEFNIARNGRSMNYLTLGGGADIAGGVRERQIVPTLPLDAMLQRFRAPDVLKIDVEGAEHLVLADASRVLETGPTLLLEAFERNRDGLGALLASKGYTFLEAESRRACESLCENTIAICDRSL